MARRARIERNSRMVLKPRTHGRSPGLVEQWFSQTSAGGLAGSALVANGVWKLTGSVPTFGQTLTVSSMHIKLAAATVRLWGVL